MAVVNFTDMNMKTLLQICVWAISCLSVESIFADTHRVEGRVLLSDTLHAASFASIYVPATGQGTVCDKEGYFLLDGITLDECAVEVSFVGYSTHKEVIHFQANQPATLNVTMQEEPITLANVFITPNGEDVSVYLFQKVLDQAKLNRKRVQHFDANVQLSLHSQDMDFIPMILPKMLYFLLKGAMKMSGFGAVVDLVFKNPVVDLDIRYRMDYSKGKLKYVDDVFVKTNPELTQKQKEECLKMVRLDPFESSTSDIAYALKMAKKDATRYKLVGTIEEQGHVVDILEYKRMQGDTLLYSCRYYIMEDVWSLLRLETKSKENGESRLEFRSVGEDIYLPVLHVELPSPVPFELEAMLADVKKQIEEGKEKPSGMEKSIIKRLEDLSKSNRKFEPYMLENFSIQYNNVVINNK